MIIGFVTMVMVEVFQLIFSQIQALRFIELVGYISNHHLLTKAYVIWKIVFESVKMIICTKM